MGGRYLTDDALAREMIAAYGLRRATSLLGWCVLFSLAGVSGVHGMRKARIGSTGSRYKAVVQLQLLALHLRQAGYDLDAVEPDQGNAVVVGSLALA